MNELRANVQAVKDRLEAMCEASREKWKKEGDTYHDGEAGAYDAAAAMLGEVLRSDESVVSEQPATAPDQGELERLRGVISQCRAWATEKVNRCCGRKAGKQFCESYGCGTLQDMVSMIDAALAASKGKEGDE